MDKRNDNLKDTGLVSIRKQLAGRFSYQLQADGDAEARVRGPYGLNVVHTPPEPVVDFIFVHGIGGGSFKTWRKQPEDWFFWPQSWLPLDNDLANVRVLTFGYDSSWSKMKTGMLNIPDFARYLLRELTTSPHMRNSGNTPIVLIGHSMGGLVIKQAYILARQESDPTAERIKCLFFLATLHRGADSAKVLRKVLKASESSIPRRHVIDVIADCASTLETINDNFRQHADTVRIWSFFEVYKTKLGARAKYVVEKHAAVIGFKHEKYKLMYTNHRGMCKFDSPKDPNYVSLKNTLALTVEEVLGDIRKAKEDEQRSQMRQIGKYLGVTEGSEDDLANEQDLKTEGTCLWIEAKDTFQKWRDGQESGVMVYYLRAKAGAGKSICTAHVVTHLQACGLDCSYYFFKHGNAMKESIGGLLRSLAYQMSRLHHDVRATLISLIEDNVTLDKLEDMSLWRKIFVNGVLKTGLPRPQYWVIDGLDECVQSERFLRMITRMQSQFNLRIFISGRITPKTELHTSGVGQQMMLDKITSEDTRTDMTLYLNHDIEKVPVENYPKLIDTLICKSSDCFLWLRLVREELYAAYSEETVFAVIDEMPSGMSSIYRRSLEAMSKNWREKALTQAILTWVCFTMRPLKVAELQAALKIDIGVSVTSMKFCVEGLGNHLLYVDEYDTVQLIHPSLREYLQQEDLDSEFSLKSEDGHQRLAKACLTLLDRDLRPRRSTSPDVSSSKTEQHVLADYSCTYVSDHFGRSTPKKSSLMSVSPTS